MKNVNDWKAWLLFVVALFFTLFASFFVKFQIDKKDEAKFRFECKEISSKIDLRMHAHAQLLRSGTAFFDASDSITREDWHNFIAQSKVNLNLPGILGTGFSMAIPKDKLPQHIRQIRNEGFLDYKVWPEYSRETFTSIIFLEPFSGSNLRAFGYDMMSEPVRREAMERARDMDIAALSGKVLLVQETGTDVQAGNLMYLPVYQKGAMLNTVEQRRAAIKGWVYSPYRMNDLMLGILENWELNDNNRTFYLHIFDGENCSSQSLLFESHRPEEQENSERIRFSLKVPVDFNGHLWTLEYTQQKENVIIDYPTVWLVFLGGILISILLLFLSRSLIGTRYRAIKIAKTLTSELKESERLLRESNEIASLGTYDFNLRTGVWKSSEILDIIYGINENYKRTVEGWTLLLHPDYREPMTDYLNNSVIKERQTFDKQYKVIRYKDKKERWVHGLGKLEFDSNNDPIRLIGTIRDITIEKRAEERLNLSREQYQSLFDNSPLGIYQSTPDGKILNANKALLQMLEFESLAELQNIDLATEGYSKDSTINRKQFVEMIERDGYVKGLEESWTTKSGRVIPIRENARIVKGINGDVVFEGTVEDISERKKAEIELKFQKEFLKMVIDTSPNLIFVKDWDGRFTLVNKKMAELYGQSIEEMIGKMEMDINPNKKEAKKFLLDDREVMTTLQSKIIPEVFFMNNVTGEKHWFHTEKVPLILSNGESRQVLGVVSDITKRKQSEEIIRQISNRLQLATQTANIGIWDLDVVKNKLFWDKAMYSLYGITEDTFSGVYEAWESGLHPEDKARADEELQMALRGEKDFNTEFRVLWPDNSVHYLKAFGSVQRNDKGEPIRMLGTTWDISLLVEAKKEIEKKNENLESIVKERTLDLVRLNKSLVKEVVERKQVEISLLENSEIIRTIFEVVPEAILTIDARGRIKSFNPAAVKLFGYAKEEVINKNINILMPEPYRSEHDTYIKNYLGTNNPKIIGMGREVFAKRKNGTLFPIDLTVAEMKINHERMFTGVITDITERKQFTQKLEHAKEKAEIANRAKSEFLANMSHEIRTPMNAVIGFSDLLAKSVIDEKQKSQIESIRSSGKNLLKIINDILDLSKIEASKIDIEPTSVNLLDLLKEVENMFAPKVMEKGIHFALEYESETQKMFLLDEVRLRQILFNLIGNAIKFTDEGRVFVCVCERKNHQDKDKIDLIIRIEDTAMGIPDDQMELIFEPFAQQIGLNSKYGGTGLGLSITKKLIEKMGGSISLESEVGKGSLFTVIIPSVSISDDEIVSANKTFDYSEIQFKEAKILLVDDNVESRKLIMDMLEYSQLTVFEANNGKEAVEIALEHLPDLILMDLRMPVMNGYEAIKILKSMQSTESIPVIAISASTKKEMHENSSKNIFSEYLMKPIDASKLFDKMKKYLKYEIVEKTDAKDTDMRSVVLTKKQINKLPELIAQLENEFLPTYNNVTKSQMIDEIEEFGKDLRILAEDSKIECLLNHATDICSLADNFEIDKLLKTLDGFPKIIEQLKMNIYN